MPNKITYTIKTSDGKEHQVSKENIDKHGIQAYADAYEGATIRMRDSKKGDYDIPLANYNDAKAQGLHAFSWEHLPPKAQPQAKQQVAQKQSTQQVATTAPGAPMTAAQKAQVLNNANNIIAQSQSDLSRTMRKFDYAKQNTGLDVKPIKLGENRNVATKKNKNGQTTYLDAEGNRFDDHAQANFSQTQIEEDEAKRKDLLGYIDKKAMSSVNSAYDKQYSELEDFKKKHPYLSAFSRALSAFSGRMSGGGTANINQYRPEEARAGLAALALNQKTRQAIDEGKRYEQGDTGFWGRATRGLKKGLTSASTYDLGLSDTDIAGSLKGAADRYAKGQATQMDELLLDAAALNSETEGKYADALGGWFGAGEGIPGVASFMMQIGSNPMSGFGKATAQSVAKTVTKRAVQKFGTGLAAKAAITLAKGATRVAADAVEAGVVTAMYSPTKIVGDYLNRKTGTVVHDGNGGYTFEGKEYSDIKAVAKAINDQNAENLSEMWGDYLPGIGKVGKLIGKGARKIGLGKVVNAFEQMSSSQWMKTWNEFMDRTKWNGLSGEYMEEAEKNLYNALTNGDMTLDTNPNTGVFSRKINEDTFKSVALMSGIMSGISTVGYTRFKYKASRGQKKADNNAKAVLGAEKWSEIKKLIDNADDKSIGGIIEQIGNDNSLNTKQKMAILDYQYKSAVAHGANIQDLKNKLEGNYDEKANRYDAGYNATEDELANIKNELELRQRQLAETFKDDPKALQQIEDDPKAFLQGLKESEVGGEKAKVINAYEETRAAYDGMIQRVKDNIDDAVTENNTVIEQRTHQDGNIYPATMKLDDRKVYVVGGNVQMNEDGKGIDHEKSSSSVMIRDAETGKIEMVDPSAILSIDTPVNAEEEKATSSEQIRQTYAQEQANKIDGVLEFKAGDTYSILGEDKKQHTIQIVGEAIDEKTKQPNPDMVMASIDGLEPTMLSKEQIQAMNNEENLWRLDQSLKQGEEVENTTPHSKQSYGYQKKITLTNGNGNLVRGEIVSGQNEDGRFEVQTEEPVNGKTVNHLTAEELDAMHAQIQEEQEESPALVAENATTQKEDVSGVNDGTIAENATVQKEETPQRQSTALERIPTNEQGEPIYEQADPETAWDAIVEQTEGDESIAQSVADGMVADMEAAVKRAEKAKVKGGTTIAEKIAAEKERVATIEQAKARLEHWKKIASTNSRRQEAIQAEESRKAKEVALLRKEQEEKERAMREEEERVKRDLAQPQSLDYKLSDEIDENGHPFVLTSAGEVAFGKIGKETGLAPAPILLSEGVITNSKTNAGYGLVHIEARHGEQIRNAGYPSVVAFVEEVAKHYDVIREGINRSGEQTYMLQLTDRHNNTLMVELSGDGTYYNINTAGIFKTSYGKNRREVYNRHTTDNQSTESGEESQGEAQSGTTSPSRMKSSTRSSAGKVSETSNAMQENAEKTSENEAKELATNAVVEALVRAGVPVEVVSDEAAKGVLPLGAEKHVVYHGSGAKFDHFDHSHMGEGEGAQAYGWGSYVTEVEGIGKKYAQAMLKEKYKENRTINEMARDRLISDGSKDESLKYLNDLLKEEWVDKKRVKAQIKIIETGKFLPEGKVSLYTVDIPDNTGKNYLDWESDIPVKEKNRIRIALTKSIIDKMGSATSSERQDVRNSISTEFRLDVRNFKGIYKLMSSYTSPQEASELLRNLGYTGISYPAQYLSGGRSDGARNYVIFDEKDLKITNRVEFMKSPDGVVYGWTIGGRIYLTKAGLNPETPIHEYTHIWANAMKVHNMKGWKSIKELLVDTPIWDEVLNDENYSNIRNDEDSVASEVLSRISGKENAKRMEEEAQKVIADSKDLIEKAETLSVLNRVRKALKTFWSWVGKELFDIEKFNSINEVTDRVLYDLVNGTALQVQNEATRVETNPTEAQKEAGNYKKGHIKVDGMNITIEQPKGSIRRGKDASGKEWESEMHNTYGYIRGTEGVDGDHIDIFLSDNPNEGNVFVVDQVNKDGSFDEHKVMYGFADKESARKAYLSNYEDGWQGLGNITEVSKEEFKKWIGSSKRKTKPFAEYKGIIKSNKSVSSPVAMSEDEYLTSKGLNGNMTDYMLDKLRIPHSETARQQKQREKEAARVRADFDNQKEEARKEYRQKIAKGELREPTKQEAKEREIAKLIKTANGHEDNPSVQAARRLLAKRGVDWRTDRGDTSDNDWLKSKEDGKSNVVHSFGNSASQNDTSIKLSDTSFAKMKNGEQKAEEAERKGYSKDSSYQGSLAFNGSAPYQNAYFETKEERKEAWENDEYEDTMSLGDYVDSGIDTNNLEWNLTDPMALRQADPDRREAIENLRQTVRSNSKTITIYRAVDANIKENEIRNGDWVTPSRSYAEYHIGLQDWENGRIIEQEVSIDDLWWDGNDIAEWGYDNGKGEVYKNTPNNRKMFEVTYDDKGNIIPLSKRFNDQVEDERFRNDEELEEANQRFNEELENLTEENADKVTLWLGKPSDVLLSSGIENKPLKLYGNKVIKKMKKHGFALDELRDLPKAVADPIAVFDNYQREGNRTILTELRSQEKNIMVAVTLGKNGVDVDFNIVSSVFGKGSSNVVDWISKGYLAYVDKEKALNYLYFSERNISEAADNSRLSSAANIVKSFENPTNSSEKVLDRKTTQAEEVAEKEHQQMAERANELAETLHLDNVEIVTDASTLEGKKAKAKGFYSTSTGKITIVIPNHSNIADVEKTLLHEAVAHHGLRKLFGEHFDNFLDNVFKDASEDVRREIVKLAAKNKWDFRIATEEYLASLAEDTNFEKMPNGFWDKIKRLFIEMLRSIGLLKQKDGELNDNELRYILWRSYKNLKEKGQSNSILNKAEDIAMQHRLKVGNYSESTDKEVRFRDGEPQSKERVSAAERYEQRVSRSMFQSQEALQDSMLGLKEAMDAIMRAEGKEMYMEDIEGFENAYLGENRLSSVNQAETEAFAHLVFKPMLDEVAKLAKNDKERSELTDYMMAKHGLERNEVMRKNALEEIINNEKLSDAQKDARASIAEHRDYAGLTALTDANSVEEAESEAQRMVEEYEQKHDTTNLWDKVNTVTKGILSKSYECGMMNKQTYEKVRDMYQFYIPLRGFDEETSREAYAYLSHGQSAFNAPIKTAKGRSSKADDPFANMQSMAESAIMQGNRNVLVKQKFLNFALNHPSDLVSVNALWLKYDDVKEEWRPVFPDNIEETDTADEVEKKIQDFEQRMTDLAKQDPERYKHGKDTENIPYRIVESRDLRQHQVVVKRNGRDYVLTINGNPRAAQALNGLTNPDNDVSGAIGAILNFGEKINRQLSAFYTTRNPDFVISNFIRDMLYANSIVWVKERPNYALRFHRNIGRCNPAQMKILLSKHKKGELDMNNSLEHMFHQFIMNGGETGYANVRDIEQHKNDIQRELKRANGKIGIKRSLSLLGEKLDEYNRAVENCARFAAFLTSREMGRTIDRSIYDAKDISVNFNKKGSGAKFMKATGQTKIGKTSAFISGIGRSGYVFWNAAIQGTTNFGRQFKRHPAKAFTASATMFILGALIAGMGMGDDGDDDKNSYWNLPESVRRSNILFRVGEQWVSIPLPVEYRSIYGMGELMISAMSGKEHFTNSELGKAIAGQVTQILPIDFLEGEGGVKAFVPSAVKPFAEVISNKGWTGMPIYKDTPYNKNMPEWTKTYKSANKYLVGLAKILNEKTGGDAYTKGAVNINPAQIEYLLNGYFGGVSNTIDKLTKSAETIAGKRDYDPKSFLLLNRVLKSGDERTEERAINREYYRLKEEYEILRDRLKNYENDTDNGVFDYSEKINFLYNSPEYARYEIFEDYRGDIESLYKELKEPMSDEERASIEAELTGLKKQMIEEMNTTRK